MRFSPCSVPLILPNILIHVVPSFRSVHKAKRLNSDELHFAPCVPQSLYHRDVLPVHFIKQEQLLPALIRRPECESAHRAAHFMQIHHDVPLTFMGTLAHCSHTHSLCSLSEEPRLRGTHSFSPVNYPQCISSDGESCCSLIPPHVEFFDIHTDTTDSLVHLHSIVSHMSVFALKLQSLVLICAEWYTVY